MTRVRIADVAARAGVSKGAASFALNGRPGVSEETRARVLQAAVELGWAPHAAARALAGGRTDTIGLVMNRPPHLRGAEPLFQQYLEGVQDELVDHAISLLIKVVAGHRAELATYEEWAHGTRVDGLVVIDLRVGDDRPAVARRLGVPVVVLGDPVHAAGAPAVWVDDRTTAVEVIAHLAGLGHRRIARMANGVRLAHTVVRTQALLAAARDAGLPEPVVVVADITSPAGQDLTRQLLTGADRPTAIVYENDLQAMAGMAVAAELGLEVPGDLSVLAWDASGLGRLTLPTVTTVQDDPHERGAHAVRLLLDLIEGEPGRDEQDPPGRLSVHDSTGPVPTS
ncbi:MAG: LacI family transcriptional regulator [Actinobacteria bacterium]|nr:LacI family transcriptional regulator [Actinomycetota bacterium]MCG2801975.1 LacI family transcriptional regulator [Cellulomonas sp.]